MSNRSIATLAFRIIGLFVCLDMLTLIQGNVSWLGSLSLQRANNPTENDQARVAILLTGGIVLLVQGILAWSLIFRCHEWAARLFPQDEPAIRSDRILAFHEFTVSMIGLFILGKSLSYLPHAILSFTFLRGSPIDWTRQII